MLIAFLGQLGTQQPQATQLKLSTCAFLAALTVLVSLILMVILSLCSNNSDVILNHWPYPIQ
jgi:hypothetical protein